MTPELAEIHARINLSIAFYNVAADENNQAAFTNNATDAEKTRAFELYQDISLMQTGTFDPGPYVIIEMDKVAKTAGDFETLSQRTMELAELYASVVTRTEDDFSLKAAMQQAQQMAEVGPQETAYIMGGESTPTLAKLTM